MGHDENQQKNQIVRARSLKIENFDLTAWFADEAFLQRTCAWRCLKEGKRVNFHLVGRIEYNIEFIINNNKTRIPVRSCNLSPEKKKEDQCSAVQFSSVRYFPQNNTNYN